MLTASYPKTEETPPALTPLALSIDAIEGEWFLAHTKGRAEKQLAWEFLRLGVPYYLPLSRDEKRDRQRHRYFVDAPVFSGYVFFAGDKDTPAIAKETGHVCSTLAVTKRAKFVANLIDLEKALRKNPSLKSCSMVQGTRCRVTDGPFEGFEGVVLRRANSSMLVIEVEAVGYAAIEIEQARVEPIQ